MLLLQMTDGGGLAAPFSNNRLYLPGSCAGLPGDYVVADIAQSTCFSSRTRSSGYKLSLLVTIRSSKTSQYVVVLTLLFLSRP